MVQEVLIKLSSDVAGLKEGIDELVKMRKVDKENAEQFKRTEAEHRAAMEKTAGTTNFLSSQFTKLGATMAATFGVYQVINFAKETLLAAENVRKVDTVLGYSMGKRTAATQELIKLAEELESVSGVDDETIKSQMSFLALQGRTEEQIKKTIKAALDMSKATGDNFESAVMKLDGTMEGALGKLGKFDKSLKSLSKEQLQSGKAIDILGEKYEDVAKKSLTFSEKLGVWWDRVKESVGGFFTDMFVGKQKTYSEQLLTQKSRLNELAYAVLKTNEGDKERVSLLAKLNKEYPDLLKGLDKEHATNLQIAAALEEVNKQYMIKISVARFEEKFADDLQDASDATIALSDAEAALNEEIFKYIDASKDAAEIRRYMSYYGITEMQAEIKLASEKAKTGKNQLKILEAEVAYKKALAESNEANAAANKILKQKTDLIKFLEKAYGTVLEQEKESVENTVELTDAQKNSAKELTKLADDYEAALEKIGKSDLELLEIQYKERNEKAIKLYNAAGKSAAAYTDLLRAQTASDAQYEKDSIALLKKYEDEINYELKSASEQEIETIRLKYEKLLKEAADNEEKIKGLMIKGKQEEEQIIIKYAEKAFELKQKQAKLEFTKTTYTEKEYAQFELAQLKEKYAALNTQDIDYATKKVDLQQAIVDKEKDIIDKATKEEEELLKTRNEQAMSFMTDLSDAMFDQIESNHDAMMSMLDDEITQQEKNIETQRSLAERGLANTLSFEETKARELEKKKLEAEKREQKRAKAKEATALALAFIEAYNKEMEVSGVKPSQALTAAFRDTMLAKILGTAIGSMFEEGGVVGIDGIPVSNKGVLVGARHSGGGIPIVAEGGEGIFSRKEMANLGIGKFYALKSMLKMPVREDIATSGNGMLIAKVDELNQTFKEIPKIVYNIDGLNQLVKTEIRNGMKEVTTFKRRTVNN